VSNFADQFAYGVRLADDWYAADNGAMPLPLKHSIEGLCANVRAHLSGQMPIKLSRQLYALADNLSVPTRSTSYADGIMCLEHIVEALKKTPKERRQPRPGGLDVRSRRSGT
jgi:hypothetical protein